MAIIRLNVNGRAHSVDVDPATPLLYVLRNDLRARRTHGSQGLTRTTVTCRAAKELCQ